MSERFSLRVSIVGNFSEVYIAKYIGKDISIKNMLLGKEVIVAVKKPKVGSSREVVEGALHEAWILQYCDHPNIIKVGCGIGL